MASGFSICLVQYRMLTQQEAARALVALAKEIVRLWKTSEKPLHLRFPDDDKLDMSHVTWLKGDSDDVSLSASWWYIDAFLDAAQHGFKDLDGISWPEAVALMEGIAERLAEGQPIDEVRVLRYVPSQRHGCNPAGALSRLFKPK